ncbi:MAG: DUF1573 domain-containing protein [Bacteroidales bacterium]|nr:DUF1573 domain-containing protein [Bacteroidales bacterium]
MKRLIMALCLLITGGQFYNNYAQFSEPSITFDKTSFNFGNISEIGGTKTHIFTFMNNGSQPLIVHDASSTCGCTIPEWSKEPIPPGGTGNIKVTFDPMGRPGAFRKNINVKTNARESTVSLYIVGLVTPKPKTVADDFPVKIGNLRIASNHVAMQTVFNSQVKIDTVQIFNDSDSTLNVAFAEPPAHLSFTVKPATLEPKQRGLIYISFDGTKVSEWGFMLNRVMFKLNGVTFTDNLLAISASIDEDFSKWSPEQKLNAPKAILDEESYNFGTITPGQPVTHDFILKNEGKDPLIIRKISTTCGCTASKPDKYEIKGGESTTLKCSFDSRGKKGKQFQTITLIVNDPLQSNLVLRFLGDVESKGN